MTTGVATAATTNGLAVETTGTTEAPKPTKQENTTSKEKAKERTTTTTSTPLGPKKTATTGTPEKKGQQTKQQPQVEPRGPKQQTQNTTGN